MPGHLKSVLTVQQRIASVAQRTPKVALTSLAHYIDLEYIDLEWLTEAYYRTRKDGCAGMDDMTGKEYGCDLEAIREIQSDSAFGKDETD